MTVSLQSSSVIPYTVLVSSQWMVLQGLILYILVLSEVRAQSSEGYINWENGIYWFPKGFVFVKVISNMKNIHGLYYGFLLQILLSCISLQYHLCHLVYQFGAEADNKSVVPVSNFRRCTAGIFYIHICTATQSIFYFSLRSQPIGWSSLVTMVTTFVPGDSWGPSECNKEAHHHPISLSQAGDTEMRVGVGWLSDYE